MKSKQEELIKALVDAGWTQSEEQLNNGETIFYFVKGGELIYIGYEPFPDYEVIEDIFGEDIAKKEMPDESQNGEEEEIVKEGWEKKHNDPDFRYNDKEV